MIDKKQFQDFRRSLLNQAEALEPDDRRRVPNLHGSVAEDVIQRLYDDLEVAAGSGLFYFTGQRGTGKSTELKLLQKNLNNAGFQPVLFDSLEFISESRAITLEELWLMMVTGIADWIHGQYKVDTLETPAWRRFTDWLQTEVEFKEISVSGIKAHLKEQQARVADAVRTLGSAATWLADIRSAAEELVQLIKDKSGRDKVVVIVDSLERLRGVSFADQEDMFYRVVNIFGGDIDKLRIPGAHVVYSVPPYLPLLSVVRNYVEWYALASVRVFEKPDIAPRAPREAGLSVLEDLVTRRYPDWASIISREALRELALYSGGDLRHFMQRLVSAVVNQAMYVPERLPLAKGDSIIAAVLAENRSQTEQLTRKDEWPLLKSVTESHNAIAANNGELAVLARLFDTRVILNYRNGAEWFDVHPLLWPLIDAYQPPTSTA